LKGIANPDFPGMARFLRQVTLNGVPHVHFNGAGGNIGAGKYNDGSPRNRQELATRLADAMADAWDATERQPITSEDISWRITPVVMPAADHLNETDLTTSLADTTATESDRKEAARDLVWLRRCSRSDSLYVSCLDIGTASIVHMPGEAVVEYQLFAQETAADRFVAVAAYGDYGSGYICLTKHYDEGGYEASPRASRVAPSVEPILKDAIRRAISEP
jgi:hypothetical protein